MSSTSQAIVARSQPLFVIENHAGHRSAQQIPTCTGAKGSPPKLGSRNGFCVRASWHAAAFGLLSFFEAR